MMKNNHFRCVLWLFGCEANHIMVFIHFIFILVINQWLIIKYLITNRIINFKNVNFTDNLSKRKHFIARKFVSMSSNRKHSHCERMPNHMRKKHQALFYFDVN